MSRKIESGKRLTKADKEYIRQRSWLRLELGLTAEDLGADDEQEDRFVDLTTPPHDPDEVRRAAEQAGGATAHDGSGSTDPQDDYDKLTVAKLTDELKRRELPVDGNKPELVARLREDDAKVI